MSDEVNDGKSTEQGSGLPPNFSQLLNKVLANPEIIGAVASALSSSQKGENSEPKREEANDEKAEKSASDVEGSGTADVSEVMKKLPDIAKLMSAGSATKSGGSTSNDRRVVLLSAIKPYVSPQRREAIDYILGFGHIADVLKNFK